MKHANNWLTFHIFLRHLLLDVLGPLLLPYPFLGDSLLTFFDQMAFSNPRLRKVSYLFMKVEGRRTQLNNNNVQINCYCRVIQVCIYN